MLASVNDFVTLYMVEAAKEIGGKAHDMRLLDRLTELWESKQDELAQLFAVKPKKKRKRSSSGKKRGKSAYMFFCAEARVTIKEELPDLKGREVMSELGRRWKKAKTGDTSKWDDLAKADKERVQSQSEDEPAPKSSKAKSSKAKSPKAKSPKAKSSKGKGPTKARSAYVFFCKEMRPKVKEEEDELTPREVMSELGKRWRVVKAEGDIGKWEKLATKDKARYKAELEQDQPDIREFMPPHPSKAKSPKAKAKAKAKAKPKAKAKSKKRIYAYSFWAKMHRSEISRTTELKGKLLTTELRQQWKALSKEEQTEWKEAAAKAAEE